MWQTANKPTEEYEENETSKQIWENVTNMSKRRQGDKYAKNMTKRKMKRNKNDQKETKRHMGGKWECDKREVAQEKSGERASGISVLATRHDDDDDDTGCSPEDLPEAMNDREKWRESVRDIRAGDTTWWWWWWYWRKSENNRNK